MVSATDPDGDLSSIRLLEAPAWLNLDAQIGGNAMLSGLPSRENTGVHLIRLEASDSDLAVEQSFTLHVGYDLGGRFETDHYISAGFFSGCQRSESGPGAYYRMELTPFGKVTVTERFRSTNEPTVFDGSYTVSRDTLVVVDLITGNEPREHRYYWLIDLPHLRHLFSDFLPEGCQPDIELVRQ